MMSSTSIRIKLCRDLVFIAFGATLIQIATADCSSGDLPCACKEAGGKWRPLKDPLKPTCTLEFVQDVNGKGM